MTPERAEPAFRPARRAEAARIGEIGRLAYAHYEDAIGVRPRPLDDDYDARVRSGVVWVADHSGGNAVAIGGFIILEPREDHLWIDNVAVDPARQGAGLGRALLDFAERRARDLGLTELRLLTSVKMERNIALYRRRGYADRHERFEQGRQRLHMCKRI